MIKLRLNFDGVRCVVRATSFVILATAVLGCATVPGPSQAGSYSSHNTDNSLLITSDSYEPPKAMTLYAMSRILVSQGKDDQGELVLARLIRMFPEFIPAYCDLAELRMRQGRVDDAIEGLSEGLQVAPRDPILLNNSGVCAILKHDYEGALNSFTLAAEVVPRDDRYRANMALALGMLGRYEESLSLYKEVLEPESADENMRIINELLYESIKSSL